MDDDERTRLRILEETRVTRQQGDDYWAHKNVQIVVYGLIGLLLSGLVAAFLALVVKR